MLLTKYCKVGRINFQKFSKLFFISPHASLRIKASFLSFSISMFISSFFLISISCIKYVSSISLKCNYFFCFSSAPTFYTTRSSQVFSYLPCDFFPISGSLSLILQMAYFKDVNSISSSFTPFYKLILYQASFKPIIGSVASN